MLGNDSDADGDTLSISAVSDPSHGLAVVEPGGIRRPPPLDNAEAAGPTWGTDYGVRMMCGLLVASVLSNKATSPLLFVSAKLKVPLQGMLPRLSSTQLPRLAAGVVAIALPWWSVRPGERCFAPAGVGDGPGADRAGGALVLGDVKRR